MATIYLIGSLRNPDVPVVAQTLRQHGHDVFDDWYAAGPEADDWWQRYEQARGRTLAAALQGYAANHIFHYDCQHMHRCDTSVLVLPAGRSGHLEFGYVIGQGKRGYVLFPGEWPERWDCMYRFASGCFTTISELVDALT